MLTIDLFEKWSNKYKKSINCSNPKGFSQKAHCAGRKKHNESVDNTDPEFIQALRSFLPIVVKHLKLKSLPKIHLQKQVNDVHVASFGGYDDDEQAVTLVINNRQPADILRTLAHELVHWNQGQNGQINTDSWKDGSNLENEANAVAGVIMREFARHHPECLEYAPIKLEENLRDWFGKEKWVRMDTKGKIKGPCAREPGEGKPKCLPQAKAHALGKKGRASAAQKKRRKDPNPERKGKAINVATKESQLDEKCWKGYHKEGNKKMFGKTVPNCVKNESQIPFDQCPQCGGEIVHESLINEKKDACYHKVKSRYKVWPSAYASGALVQCRKKGAANWGNKSK